MIGKVYILFLPFLTSLAVEQSTSRRRSRYADIPLLVCTLLWASFSGASNVGHFEAGEYRTETGEQRVLPLADGSTIIMDVESTLRIADGEGRKVYLDQGQAAFEVTHDSARPFTVQVDQTTIQTVRSHFYVRHRADFIIVSIVAGELRVVSATDAVRVTSPKLKSTITKGRQLNISPDGTISKPVITSMAHIALWRERRLAFRHHTLVEIADEFNRYNKVPKLRVEGEVLKQRTFSGVIDADDPQTLLDYLAKDELIEFDREDPGLIVIRFRSRYGFARVGQ